MTNLDNIVDRLQSLKRNYDASYGDIAHATGLSRHACADIHHGLASVETLTKIAAFYGFDLNLSGHDLRAERLSQRRSISELARSARVSDAAVKRVESGFDQVRLSTFCAVADALGVRLALTRVPVARAELHRWQRERVVPSNLFIFDDLIEESLIDRIALYEARASQ